MTDRLRVLQSASVVADEPKSNNIVYTNERGWLGERSPPFARGAGAAHWSATQSGAAPPAVPTRRLSGRSPRVTVALARRLNAHRIAGEDLEKNMLISFVRCPRRNAHRFHVVMVVGILAAISIPKSQNTQGNVLSLCPSPGGTVTSTLPVSGGGWSAMATHPLSYPLWRTIFYGQASPSPVPAVADGVQACQ